MIAWPVKLSASATTAASATFFVRDDGWDLTPAVMSKDPTH